MTSSTAGESKLTRFGTKQKVLCIRVLDYSMKSTFSTLFMLCLSLESLNPKTAVMSLNYRLPNI